MTWPDRIPFAQGIDKRAFLRTLGGAVVFSLCGCGLRKRTFEPVIGATSAARAVNASRRFAGTELNVGWESGPQAQALARFAAPLWKELTGVRINIVEMGWPLDQFKRVSTEHRAGTGALDCASIAPTWIPDLVADNVLEPLDEYVSHYLIEKDLEDYLPLYRNMGVLEGQRFGFFDDGDTLLLFFRSDLFNDPSIQSDFAAKYGRSLGDPRRYDWGQFMDVARFFTEKFAPNLYGLAPLSRELCWACFGYRLRMEGGEFFDRESMKPGIYSNAGLQALTQVAEMLKLTVPMGSMETLLPFSLSSFLSGKTAMAIFWPPLGRLAEQIDSHADLLGFLPRSQVAGKTGYALLPGGKSAMAVGFVLPVLAHSRNKEAAYLFTQWLTSPSISLERVKRPDTFRDPYRFSHLRDPSFRNLWPTAGEYLDTLGEAASGAALLELTITGIGEYQEAFYEALTNVRLGVPVEKAISHLAEAWEQITSRRGRRRQRRSYAEFLRMPGAVLAPGIATPWGSSSR